MKQKYAHEFDYSNLAYVTDSQDIFSVLSDIGLPDKYIEYITALFVMVKDDGAYTQVWLTESSRPYDNHAIFYRLPDYYRNRRKYKQDVWYKRNYKIT